MEEEAVDDSPSPGEIARQERDDEIGKLYADPDGPSAEEIARRFGISEAAVRKITAKLGVSRPRGRKAAKKDEERVIDPLHQKVGIRFSSFLHFQKLRTVSEAAEELGWSPQKVSAIGKGFHNLSLTDVKQLADYMGQSLSEFLKDF